MKTYRRESDFLSICLQIDTDTAVFAVYQLSLLRWSSGGTEMRMYSM